MSYQKCPLCGIKKSTKRALRKDTRTYKKAKKDDNLTICPECIINLKTKRAIKPKTRTYKSLIKGTYKYKKRVKKRKKKSVEKEMLDLLRGEKEAAKFMMLRRPPRKVRRAKIFAGLKKDEKQILSKLLKKTPEDVLKIIKRYSENVPEIKKQRKKIQMPTTWLKFLRKFRRDNPDIKGMDVMIFAGEEYQDLKRQQLL